MSQASTSAPPQPRPARVPLAWWVFNAPLLLAVAFLSIHVLDNHAAGAIWFTMPWKMAGWGPILVGSALCAAGAGHFAKRRTTLLPRPGSRVLVTTGVFAFTRNPMYLGMAVILIGVCFIAGSATVWAVPPAFVWAIDRGLIRREEAMLADRFGDDYEAYRQRVRRWM